MRMTRSNAGFSLVEMLVVLVIGSVLYLTALGPMRSYLDGKRAVQCAENLRKFHLVTSLYASEHDGKFPAVAPGATADDAFALLVPKYSSDPGLFSCPVSPRAVGYSYVNGLSREQVAPLVLDTATGHNKASGNILFTDGHVERFEAGSRRLPPLPPGASVLDPRP